MGYENQLQKAVSDKHRNILTSIAITASVYSSVNYSIKNELGLQLAVTVVNLLWCIREPGPVCVTVV